MAIADIVERIAADAAAEAAAILGMADAEVSRIEAEAADTRARERASALERAGRDAAGEAATMLANERLAARDALLAARGAHVAALLERVVEALAALPDHEYRELIVRHTRELARGGEVLAIAEADTGRLAGLQEALAEAGIRITLAGEPAPISRGVVLTGDRVRTEISPASIVAERREELAAIGAATLFGGKG